MASQNEGYWSRSWALLTRDEGWIKPLLVLAASHLVPIVGTLGANGYALEWARLTAWGVDAAPKQRGVDVGACIKAGARAFVVWLGYAVLLGGLKWLIERVFGESLGSWITLVVGILGLVIVSIATLRATIYQQIGAGYQVNRIYDMVRRDTRGMLRIVGLLAVISGIITIAGTILAGGAMLAMIGGMVPHIMELKRGSGIANEWEFIEVFAGGLASFLPVLFVIGYVLGVAVEFSHLIVTTAVGLWMRQFDVPNCGKSADPLPGTATGPSTTVGPYAQVPEQPMAAQGEPLQTTGQPVQTPSSTLPEQPVGAPDTLNTNPSSAYQQVDAQQSAYPIPQPQEIEMPLSNYQPQSAGEAPAAETAALPEDVTAAETELTPESSVQPDQEQEAAAVEREGEPLDEEALAEEALQFARERMEAERQALESLGAMPETLEMTELSATYEAPEAPEAPAMSATYEAPDAPEVSETPADPEAPEDHGDASVPTFPLEVEAMEPEEATMEEHDGEVVVDVIDLTGDQSDED